MIEVQAVAVSADPDIALPILMDGVYIVIAKAGGIGGIVPERTPGIRLWIEHGEAVRPGARPDITFFIFQCGEDVVAADGMRIAVLVPVMFERASDGVKPIQTTPIGTDV